MSQGLELIAELCHEVNRTLTRHLNDVPMQPPWKDAPEEMRKSTERGIEWRLSHRDAPASAQHDAWMADKIADGWKLGATKDPVAKTHPALIPYDQLPIGVRLKDHVFTAIVLGLAL